DKNIPENNWYQGQFLDWTSKHLKYVGEEFPIEQNHEPSFAPSKRIYQPTPLEETNFKGINYKKAKRWQNTYYHLSKDVLVEDLTLMRDAGFNTIKVNPSTIYDYNLRKYSKKYGLNVIYQFEAKNVTNFIT